MNNEQLNNLGDHLFRDNAGKMVAVLSRIYGIHHLDLIQDVVQESFEAALTTWRFSSLPSNPSAWLMRVAKNKAINRFKREARIQDLSTYEVAEPIDEGETQKAGNCFLPHEIEDAQLRLLYACCHPSLAGKQQVILTLHILCGFSLAEISNALLLNKEAVKKTLFRAKSLLKESKDFERRNLSLNSSTDTENILTVLYLMFNEGYASSDSDVPVRKDLCFEAIRLTKLLAGRVVVGKKESHALLALMFFNISRFECRATIEGEIILLKDQDRSNWDRIMIEEGYHYLNIAFSNPLNRYYLEALIASVHAQASSFENTDWSKIAFLYKQLEIIFPSPLVTLNRILAQSYLQNSKESLHELELLNDTSSSRIQFFLSAAKGEISLRLGELQKSESAFKQALLLAPSERERKLMQRYLKDCGSN